MPARRTKTKNDGFSSKILGGVKKHRRTIVTPHEDNTHHVKLILDYNPRDPNKPYLFRSETGDKPWWGWLEDLQPRAKINEQVSWDLASLTAINIFRSSQPNHPTHIRGNMQEIVRGRTCSNEDCFHRKDSSKKLYAAHVWVFVPNKNNTKQMWAAGIVPLCASCNQATEPFTLKKHTRVNVIERVVTLDNTAFVENSDVKLSVRYPLNEERGVRFGKFITNTRLTKSFKPNLS
jgi:hypothetical protein